MSCYLELPGSSCVHPFSWRLGPGFGHICISRSFCSCYLTSFATNSRIWEIYSVFSTAGVVYIATLLAERANISCILVNVLGFLCRTDVRSSLQVNSFNEKEKKEKTKPTPKTNTKQTISFDPVVFFFFFVSFGLRITVRWNRLLFLFVFFFPHPVRGC